MSSIFDIINIPFGYVMRFCYELTHNYALALLLFALAMQIILLPLGIKQQKNMVKQASLRPREMAIRKKYAGRDDAVTKQKLNDEILKLYQEENFNPAGGCLPLLIQMPILISLYNVVTQPLRYLCGLSVEAVSLIKDALTNTFSVTLPATNPEIAMVNHIRELGVEKFWTLTNTDGAFIDLSTKLTRDVLPNFNMFGDKFDLSQIPAITWPPSWLLLVPILTFVVLIATQKLNKKLTYQSTQAESQQNALSMKMIEWSMPLLSVYFTFRVSAAIGIYWIFRNLLMVLQQFLLCKFMPYPRFTEADFKAAEKSYGGSVSSSRPKSATKVRSLHRIDEEDDDEPSALAPAEKPKYAAPLKDESDRPAGKNDETPDQESPSAPSDDGTGEPDSENGGESDDDGGAESAGNDASEPKRPNPNAPKSNYSKTGKNYKKK